jgi:beta-lactamase superfamily II metal-dependent hydrolase
MSGNRLRAWVAAALGAILLPGHVGAQRPGAAPPAALDRSGAPSVQITFLDVGQGDAVFVRTPEGRTALIDAGRSSPLRFLQQMSVDSLDLVVASHPHADHIGGLVDVLTARPVRFYMDNGVSHTTATYARLMETLERLEQVTYLQATPRTITLGSVELQVLPMPDSGDDINDRSVGLVLRFGAFSAFFSGDSERAELDFWAEGGLVPDVTLLKAPHHGSVNGFTPAFLRAARPELVVVSVGADNTYGHPRPEAMTAYAAVPARILRTDRDGHVTVLGYADGSWRVVLGSGRAREPETSGDGTDEPVRPAPDMQSDLSAAGVTVEVVPGRGGDDHRHLNAEYAILANSGPTDVPIGDLRLCDLSTRCFRFPAGARIRAGGRVRVYTGYGMTDGVTFFMNNDRSVWNDDGDEARLLAADGTVLLRHVY